MRYLLQSGNEVTILARPWAVESPYFCEIERKLVIGKLQIKFDGDEQNWECNISKDEYLKIIEHKDYKHLHAYSNLGIPLDLIMLTPGQYEKTVPDEALCYPHE